MDPAELRQQAIELEADLWSDHAEDRHGGAELLAAFADYDPALHQRALLGEAGSGAAGRDLLGAQELAHAFIYQLPAWSVRTRTPAVNREARSNPTLPADRSVGRWVGGGRRDVIVAALGPSRTRRSAHRAA